MKKLVTRNVLVSAALLLTVLLTVTLTACSDIVSPPVQENESDGTGLRITVADNTGGERTILPAAAASGFELSKYVLTFTSGSGASGPGSIELRPNASTVVNLAGGNWTITADGYGRDSSGKEEKVATGTYSLNGYTAGSGINSIQIPVSMIMDKTKKGYLQFPNIPTEYLASATLTVTEFPREGKQPLVTYTYPGDGDLQGLENIELNAGYYWIEVTATVNDDAGSTGSFTWQDIAHIYPYCVSVVDFGDEGGGGGTDDPIPGEQQYYEVIVSSYGGIVDVGYGLYQAGETVYVNVYPDGGYTLSRLSGYYFDGRGKQNFELNVAFDGRASFTMPASTVYIDVIFEPIGGGDTGNSSIYYSSDETIEFSDDGTYTVMGEVYGEDDSYKWTGVTETGTYTETGTTRTLNPQYAIPMGITDQLLSRAKFEQVFRKMVDSMTAGEIEEGLRSMGFSTVEELITWYVNYTFAEKTYDCVITSDGMLLMQEQLPRSTGTNELVGYVYNGATWNVNDDMEADFSEIYNFAPDGSYSFTNKELSYTTGGMYTYDGVHKFVYLRENSSTSMEDYYTNSMLSYMNPTECAIQTNDAFGVIQITYDPLNRIIARHISGGTDVPEYPDSEIR